ncbi:hypothetical protein HGRIS_009604 [Hohenbuehelia grisea]|uniref:SSD domain-containing protein n=1 Tax=Hohenbuehelia grisea TaxID=104357 RepID=A0ABR3J318_9AGAR
MRGSCGRKGIFGRSLPCPYDGPPEDPNDDARALLVQVCGDAFAEGQTCCDNDQVKALRDNFGLAINLISTCPACANNFRNFFCTFTCSPHQSTFLNVTETQTTASGNQAVKSVDFFVESEFAKGFFDSCKNVQVGATNGFAMDLLGGGAKNHTAFLKFLGDEKDLGSPFQINYPPPDTTPSGYTPLSLPPRNCADPDLGSRCTCIDCPDICLPLPPIDPPGAGPTCHVGALSCLSFILILAYGIAATGLFLALARRREQSYERVALSEGDNASIMSPRIHPRGLVGTTSLAQGPPYAYTDEDSSGVHSETRRLGRGASLLDPVTTVQPRHYPLNSFLRRAFYRLGLFAATSPWLTFAIVFLIMGVLNIGWKQFAIETDPVRLWVAPDSESKQQKDFFDANFGPFYRTEQIFVTATNADGSAESGGPVLSWETLRYWEKVEKHIRLLRSAPDGEPGYTLEDVCFKPAGPEGACVVQSPLAWFGNDLDNYKPDNWAKQLRRCAESPVECLPDFQQPLGPQFVLGGVPADGDGQKRYTDAAAFVVTYVVQASVDPEVTARAMAWETALRGYLQELSERAPREAQIHLAFSTEISLEEELNKSTNMDIRIVVLSYLAMFFYVALTLGNNSATVRDEDSVMSALVIWARNFPKLFQRSQLTASTTLSIDSRAMPSIFPRLPRRLFTGSKFTLGLFGIILVILSVSSSVGFFSFVGVKVTLIIAEVIPFLVLAVGVDNVYILVHELDRQNLLHGPNASLSSNGNSGGIGSTNAGEASFTTPMSPTNSHRSPFESTHDDVDSASVPLFLSPEERVARTLAKMGPSILLSSLTETVAFALGALVPMPAVRNFALYAAGSVLLNAVLQVTVFVSALLLDLKRVEASRVDCFPCIRLPSRIALLDEPASGSSLGRLARFIRHYYAPFLLRPVVKGSILLLFGGVFVASVISIQHIQLGLDRRLALPSDSYLVSYFNHLDDYLDIGPPVYFVSRDVDVTHRPGQQALCGRFTTCRDKSLANILEAERKRPESSFISEPTASWIDDFLAWLDPAKDACCRVRKNNASIFCKPQESSFRCKPCYQDKQPPWNITMEGLPEDGEFLRYVRQWLISPTTEECSVAGQAAYGTALSLAEESVAASHFRTMHKPLKTEEDFINAFAAAHRIADDISRETGANVFPYSLFYVFFDQYAHVVAVTQEILGLGLASVLIVTALMLGSWRTGTIVTGVVALTVLTVMGMMVVLGVDLNAISLVNLVISLGIAVEFCAHIARAFMSAGSGLPIDHPAGQRERDERMYTALVDVGPSVVSGITTTKLIGMSVLALTRSKLLEIYYFRMWLTLIIAGAAHGLILLPVVLSLAGGPGFPLQEADEEWMSNAIRNDYEYAPFLTDNDSVASD